MDKDKLSRHYGQRYCFQPYQADFFYKAEIQMHLKHVVEQCKECHLRPVFKEIEESLTFLARRDIKVDYIAKCVYDALHLPDQEQRYIQTRIVVYDMFKRFNEERIFDWK